MICGSCGQIFGRKVWNSTDERLRRIIWRCNGKYPTKGEKGCESRHIDDDVLYQAFVNVFNTLVENKDYFLGKWRESLVSEGALVRYRSRQIRKMLTESVVIDEFDVDLYFALVEKITIQGVGKLILRLFDETEVECVIEK